MFKFCKLKKLKKVFISKNLNINLKQTATVQILSLDRTRTDKQLRLILNQMCIPFHHKGINKKLSSI